MIRAHTRESKRDHNDNRGLVHQFFTSLEVGYDTFFSLNQTILDI